MQRIMEKQMTIFFLFPFLSFPSPTVVVVGGGGGSVSLLYVVIRCI